MARWKLTKEQKRKLKTAATWGALGVLSWEIYLAFVVRRQNRRDTFNAALNRQNETGKPLLVLGDPDKWVNRVVGRDYDCGNYCVDPGGCVGCEEFSPKSFAQYLPDLGDDSVVVFVGRGLEQVDDLPAVLEQLYRVSGGDVFVANAGGVPSLARLAGRWRLLKAPPRDAHVEYREAFWQPGPSVVRGYPVSISAGG